MAQLQAWMGKRKPVDIHDAPTAVQHRA